MNYKVAYFAPVYSFDRSLSHLSVLDSEGARQTLLDMGARLPGTDNLVAIYVPLSTDEAYQPGSARGRIVGSVRLQDMPSNKTINDYSSRDIDGSLRWPFGWPCEVVHCPPVDQGIYLRTLVDEFYGRNSYAAYANQFHSGPFKVADKEFASAILHSLM